MGHFWGVKILNFNIFGGFQKNEYFWGFGQVWFLIVSIPDLCTLTYLEDFVDIFGIITKLDYN